MKSRKMIIFVMTIVLVTLLASCGQKANINADDVRKYSDAKLENILKASNNDDYEAYSKDFSSKMKEALNENSFKEQNKIIKSKIGKYESKEFDKVQVKGEYITAIYKAKYSEEPKDVMITITFKNEDENHKVEGLYMISPKLASK